MVGDVIGRQPPNSSAEAASHVSDTSGWLSPLLLPHCDCTAVRKHTQAPLIGGHRGSSWLTERGFGGWGDGGMGGGGAKERRVREGD